MGKIYIGIDPGSKGFITVEHDGKLQFLSIEDSDMYQISRFLAGVRAEAYEHDCQIAAAMEDVAAIFGASAKSTFNFGFNKGMLVAFLCAFGIPYTLIKPQVWQKVIWTSSDKVMKTDKRVDPKPTTINAVKRLYPNVDLRKTERCKMVSEDKCDSLAICEYARRMNL